MSAGRVRRPRVVACAQILAGIALFFALDAAIFGPGRYIRWVAPLSGLGSVARALDAVRHVPPGQRSMLVMGDSRIGEGFSARTADRAANDAGTPAAFTNAAVAGSMPRVWSYLLRRILGPRAPISAVAIMLQSYHDDDPDPQAARRGDIVFVHPLLTLADLFSFPATFPTWAGRLEAADAILFKGMFYKNDLQDFLRDPADRVAVVRAWRENGFTWINGYAGRDSSLQGLRLDLDTGALHIDPAHPPTQPNTLPDYARYLGVFRGRWPENAVSTRYRRQWLGRIARQCRDAGIPLLVFRIPRGPLHYLVPEDPDPSGVVAEMARAGDITLLPATTFDALEHPEFFFDDLHMNAAGRAAFSASFGQAAARALKRAAGAEAR